MRAAITTKMAHDRSSNRKPRPKSAAAASNISYVSKAVGEDLSRYDIDGLFPDLKGEILGFQGMGTAIVEMAKTIR